MQMVNLLEKRGKSGRCWGEKRWLSIISTNLLGTSISLGSIFGNVKVAVSPSIFQIPSNFSLLFLVISSSLQQWTDRLTIAAAAAFYGVAIILIPQGQSKKALADLLQETNADILVAQAGTLPLNELLRSYSGLKQVVWVVGETSRHMDWKEASGLDNGEIHTATWHNLLEEQKGSASSDPPSDNPDFVLPNILAVWQRQTSASLPETYEVVEFTQKVGRLENNWRPRKLTQVLRI